jgi:hemerythrin-like metal-binding protein
LFKIANRFLAATTQEEQLHCADSLVEYTHSHFSYEEMLMRKLHFPMLEQHLQSHHFLISRLEEVKDQIQKNTLDRKGLEEFIQHWALVHIPSDDAKLADFMETQETMQGDIR